MMACGIEREVSWFYGYGTLRQADRVPCPLCRVMAGEACLRPNDSGGMDFHIERQEAFIRSPVSAPARNIEHSREVFV